jgi:hypothetical protein
MKGTRFESARRLPLLAYGSGPREGRNRRLGVPGYVLLVQSEAAAAEGELALNGVARPCFELGTVG